VVGWAAEHQVGRLAVGDPRGVLNLAAGRRHSHRTRDWRVRHLIRALRDKAEAAGITMRLVDERGTSSTCPSCSRRVPKPAGRNFRCPHCGNQGHRDLIAAANIAARNGGGTIPTPPDGAGITHRRAGTHLPGVHPAPRDPRRRPHHGPPPTVPWPAPARPREPTHGESLATPRGARNPAR
jgi:IS605 OrfB family transposase